MLYLFFRKTYLFTVYGMGADKESKLKLISCADEQVLDDGKLTGKIPGVTKALDLVGPKNLKDCR